MPDLLSNVQNGTRATDSLVQYQRRIPLHSYNSLVTTILWYPGIAGRQAKLIQWSTAGRYGKLESRCTGKICTACPKLERKGFVCIELTLLFLKYWKLFYRSPKYITMGQIRSRTRPGTSETMTWENSAFP